ncbi:lysozyme inhibitor LprI family protein [Caulobacter sp. KR2-114]|uniref:lysozyme inhibitor LprI family protein n=1 Tax=Caulobacter sp. KR2-114 TaxID=3400912 RepID=UPI003BFB67CC
MRWLVLVAAALAALGGCSKLTPREETTCTSPGAISVTQGLISQEVEKAAINGVKRPDGSYAVSPANVRATVALLKITIDQIRTTKMDPNSTKRFCTGSVKVVVPLNILQDAEQARSLTNASNLDTLAEGANIQRSADAFTFQLDYAVQPTDDRQSVFAESDALGPSVSFLSETVTSALLKTSIEGQAAAQQQAQQAQAEAQRQVSEAALQQAQADNKLSQQTIGAAWKAISPDTRAQILNDQRAWIAAKAANCSVQAAGASTDPMDRETARLKCDTAANQERMTWLRQYLPGE